MASSSNSTAFARPADRLVLLEKKDWKMDALVLTESRRSRRSRIQAKEQETLLAYAVGTKETSASGLEVPGPDPQPALKKVRLAPRKGFSLVVPVTESESSDVEIPWANSSKRQPGTSGPDASDGSFELVSSSSKDVKMLESDSSEDEGRAIEKAIDELPPVKPPRFEPLLAKKGSSKIYTLSSPYPGLRVDEVTFRLLKRMGEQDVVELLRPVSDSEDNVAGLRRVVEHYWLSCINIRHKAIQESAGRIIGTVRNIKSGIGFAPEPKRPAFPPRHGWTCSRCGAPRSWDESSPIPCILCSTKDPPVKVRLVPLPWIFVSLVDQRSGS